MNLQINWRTCGTYELSLPRFCLFVGGVLEGLDVGGVSMMLSGSKRVKGVYERVLVQEYGC